MRRLIVATSFAIALVAAPAAAWAVKRSTVIGAGAGAVTGAVVAGPAGAVVGGVAGGYVGSRYPAHRRVRHVRHHY